MARHTNRDLRKRRQNQKNRKKLGKQRKQQQKLLRKSEAKR